jgi:hypothetical protein
MARPSGKTQRGIGALLPIAGGGLIVWGYRESQTLGDQLNQAISGEPSNDVLLFCALGAATLVGGLALLFRG